MGTRHFGQELDSRQKAILTAAVKEYISSGQPVSSQRLATKFSFGVKAATLRNVMAELEQYGYLHQPHTSAGRIPTEKAFRYYVDTLTPGYSLGKTEREKIELYYSDHNKDPEQRVKDAARLLSALTGHTAIATAPKPDTVEVEKIELIRVRPYQVAGLVVCNTSGAHARVIETTEDHAQAELNQMAKFLTRLLRGCSLEQAAARVGRLVNEASIASDSLARAAIKLGRELLTYQGEDTIYVEGRAKALGQANVSDPTKTRHLLEILEDHVALSRALNELVKENTPNVAIGSENFDTRLSEFSVVAAAYTSGTTKLGSVGVIGPMRMNYSRIISLVEYTARTLSRAWS